MKIVGFVIHEVQAKVQKRKTGGLCYFSTMTHVPIFALTLLVIALAPVYGAPRCSDPFEVLGVQRGANEAEVRAAFKSQALKYHPDKDNSPNAAEKYTEVTNAYDTIRNGKDQGVCQNPDNWFTKQEYTRAYYSRDQGKDSRDKGKDSRDKRKDSRDKRKDSRDKRKDSQEPQAKFKIVFEAINYAFDLTLDYFGRRAESQQTFKYMKDHTVLTLGHNPSNILKKWSADFYLLEIPVGLTAQESLAVSVNAPRGDHFKLCVLSQIQKEKGDIVGECQGSNTGLRLVFTPQSITIQRDTYEAYSDLVFSCKNPDTSKGYFIAVMGNNYNEDTHYATKVTRVDGLELAMLNSKIVPLGKSIHNSRKKNSQEARGELRKLIEERNKLFK